MHENLVEIWLPRLRRMNFFMLLCAALILFIGVCFIGSATSHTDAGSASFVARQGLFILLGIIVFIALQELSYLNLLRHIPWLYVLGMLLLCGVLFTRAVHGAQKWYDLYFLKLQPSELMKPIIVLTLAHYLMYRDSYKKLLGLAVPVLLVLAPIALILRQPDLGTALAIIPVMVAMLFVAGARVWHLLMMTLMGSSGLVMMWFWVMHDYQKKRVWAWLHPELYKLGEAWQTLQAEVAIGSGGFWGKGLGNSPHVASLPEAHTDFIFAVICEEGGFIIAAILLLLVALLALSGLGLAARTREPAGRLIAVGCVTLFCSQALINSGVALGLCPTTGLTFPFVSYGGSSVISSFVCLGLLINVGWQQAPVLAREDFA
jgi:rod shape determining protein RodA